MIALDLLLRWMHIFGATILVGGLIFMCCAYAPAAAAAAAGDEELAGAIRRRWARLVMTATGLLLISGLINFVLIVKRYDFSSGFLGTGGYHSVFLIKFLLALILFFLAAALSGRSALAEKLRQNEKRWLTLNLFLAVLIVCLAGVMKIAPRVVKESTGMPPRVNSSSFAGHDSAAPMPGPRATSTNTPWR